MRPFNKYWAIFKIQLLNVMAYPSELLGRSFSIIIFMLVFASLWRTAYGIAGTDTLQGITLPGMLWYLMIAETIELSRPRVSTTISRQVKTGELAYVLNKPYNFLAYHFSTSFADSLFRMLTNALIGGIVVSLMFGSPPPAWGWPLAAIALIGAWALNFCMMALIGLAAFITEEISSFEWIFQKALFILGGMMIPLEFLPGWLRTVAERLPFAYAMYGPARLFIDPSLEGFYSLLAGQLVWLLVLGGALALAYNRGARYLAVNGG
ncbi:MAG: ABC-2 family transporter protein [Anaerolineales bacterium]|nr:ABC-2 family transporter protein [Anaerolineales bacterium]